MKRILPGNHYNNSFKKIFIFSIRKFFSLGGKLALIIVGGQILIITGFFISNRALVKEVFQKGFEKIEQDFDTLHPNDYANYFKDFSKSLLPGNRKLERIDLEIKYEAILALDCYRKYLKEFQKLKEECSSNKQWQNAKLMNAKKSYRVKLRAKGDRDLHRLNFRQMSFKVDIKGEDRYKGFEEFSIQMPIMRNYTSELFAAKLLRSKGIITPRNEYVRLYINGEYVGIRHIEESFSKEIIESASRRYGPIFSLDEDISLNYSESRFDLHDAKYWNKSDPDLVKNVRFILEETKNNPKVVSEYFDLNLWAKYFATLDGLKMWHGTYPKSVKFFLNPSTGLIEPVFFDGHLNAGRLLDDFNFFQLLNLPNDKIKCGQICGYNQLFFKNFFGSSDQPNTKFYSMYFEALEDLVSKSNINKELKPIWKSLSIERGNLYREFWKVDKSRYPGFWPHVAPWEIMLDRLENIKKDLLKAKSESPMIVYTKNDIKAINQNSVVPQILELKCNNNNFSTQYLLIQNKPKSIFPFKKNYCSKNNIIWSLDSFETTYDLNNSYVIKSPIILENKSQIEEIFNIKQKIYQKGEYIIEDDTFINNGKVVFKNGSKICLKNNSLIHIKNSIIQVEGNELNPVIIKSCEENKLNDMFSGSIIFENSQVNIAHLNLDNLIAPNLPLRKLYGGINFINSKVEIDTLNVSNSNSEDAINFIDSNVKANTIDIYSVNSDALDSDFSNLDLKKLICNNIGNDCLDLSFSKGKLQSLEAKGIGDKAISLGESSFLNINNATVNKSEIGIVSKDSSILNIHKYIHEDVKLPLAAYIKKEEFGPPTINLYKIIPNDLSNFLFSRDSLIKISNDIIKSEFTSKSIEDKLYGNEFGIKTVRP